MQYQRSLDIERRLEAVLRLVREGRHSTPEMAKFLDVSVPTVSRDLTALRERGLDIRAERKGNGWRYLLRAPKPNTRSKKNRSIPSDPSRPMGGRSR